MENTVWILIGIVLSVIVFGVIYYKKKNKVPTDYKAFFIIGITWIPLGIATKNHVFTIMGIVFMVIGAKNKAKWKSNETKWNELTPGGKTVRFVLIGLAVLFLVLGIYYYYYMENQL